MLRERFHYKIKGNNIDGVGDQYSGVSHFPLIFFRLFFHYFPRESKLAKRRYDPATPAGNCLKKLNPV